MYKHRLVSIGDSLTQGFKSGAIFEPQLSYPAIIAWEMGLAEDAFRYASFNGQGGLPINLEYLLHRLDHEYGPNINWFETPLATISLRQWMDDIEDYWERGIGTKPLSYSGHYHNLAVWGFEVPDAYQVTAGMCQNAVKQTTDQWLNQIPEHAMMRTALRVLNPSQDPQSDKATQISRANELAQDGGIENLIVFLGANNILGTVTSLKLKPSTDADLKEKNPETRKANFYSPQHFKRLFGQLTKEIKKISVDDKVQRVFWGTVPSVTIPPVTHGVGGRMDSADGLKSPFGENDHRRWYRRYFRYYTRPWIPERNFKAMDDPHLTGKQIIEIDQTIAQYNRIISEQVEAHNKKRQQEGKEPNWFIVDLHWALERLAFRRYREDPSVPPPPNWSPYELPDVYTALNLDTRFLRAKDGRRIAGGLFSLDGIHATTVGYGLIAQEFINVMQKNGVEFFWGDGERPPRAGAVTVDYRRLIALDTLMKRLPQTLDDIWDKLVDGDELIDVLKKPLQVFGF